MSATITCTRCQTENPASNLYCQKCNGTTRRMTVEEQALTDLVRRAEERPEPSLTGLLTAAGGLLGALATGWWVTSTMGQARSAGNGLSAVQVSQLYTQGSFWALLVVAVLLAGILAVLSSRR